MKPIKQWSFFQPPRRNAKPPYWKLSGDGSGVLLAYDKGPYNSTVKRHLIHSRSPGKSICTLLCCFLIVRRVLHYAVLLQYNSWSCSTSQGFNAFIHNNAFTRFTEDAHMLLEAHSDKPIGVDWLLFIAAPDSNCLSRKLLNQLIRFREVSLLPCAN